ncbi:MAG: peptidoglycan DD-metalloendopeptidase family protein [Betaproteobacteria bacterium]|jgi:lipoprotein NlpD|nr:peptidoglycan DD-metalloendopeptidase family protein [Betaproteobacteria bacterium]MBK7655003.1 peptidoglycan DD-metalloendopeptidase family protein [Betaproteobacteria bacterium]MBP6647741.1 peptidoglycan DD-metalloendopeptidase family protein [Burkholderiaceae bacterium]
MLNKLTSASRLIPWTLCCLAVAALSACGSSTPLNKAPVEDRNNGIARTVPSMAAQLPATDSAAVSAALLPGAENAGKPGYYTVKPGETLIRIAMDNGQSWRDVAKWNNLDNPNKIEIGQVLRVVPPGVLPVEPRLAPSSTAIAAAPLATGSGNAPVIVGLPLPTPTISASKLPAPGAAVTHAVPMPPAPAASVDPANADEEVGWIWPSAGTLLAGFDEAKNKGLDLGGKVGDPVYAVGDGRVVYSGAGLRGYGNLIILKHNNTYLSAYAHNQTLLVKEDQSVRKGQKIAEMGASDTDKVKLHFEIRRLGKPVDPVRYLPAR